MEDSRGHSRRRGSRHPALVRIGDGPLWGLPSTQEEISSGAGESGGLSRRRRRRRRTRRSGTRSQSQASSSGGAADSDLAANLPLTLPGNPNQALPYSSALRSDHPGTRAHVRQSVLYSDRPRRNRPRRPALAEEYTCEERSSELGRAVMDLPTVEALSLSDCPLLSASDSSFIPQSTEEKPPKDSDAEAQEFTHEESSSEIGKAIMDLPTIEALTLSEPPLMTSQTGTDEETDDDCAEVPTSGQTALFFNQPKGLSRSMILSLADSMFTTVSIDKMQCPRPCSDEDPEELRLRIKEYLDACPCIDLSVASDRIEAIDDANLNAHGAELDTEPSSVLTEQASVAAERNNVSTAWMDEEVMLCFKKLIDISPDLAELEDYHLDKLRHQCFNVERYDKVYHHYNFTVRMKMPNSADWTVELYFAEVKEIFRTKHYLCYPLEPNENGQCYACRSQGVEELRHPTIGLYEMGSPDVSAFNLWYSDD